MVYSVIGYHKEDRINGIDPKECTTIFGVFSTEEKAMEILRTMLDNFEKAGEEIEIVVTALELDKPTKEYDFFMTN